MGNDTPERQRSNINHAQAVRSLSQTWRTNKTWCLANKILGSQCNDYHEDFGVQVELWKEALNAARDHNTQRDEDGQRF